MIRLRLTDRARTVIVQGLSLLVTAKESAKKKAQAAFSPTAHITDEIVFIAGDGKDEHGLIGLIGGRQTELFEGGLVDEKLELLDEIERRFSTDLVRALFQLGVSAAREGAKINAEPVRVAEQLQSIVDTIPRAVAGMEGYDAEDYSRRRYRIEERIADGEEAVATAGLRIAASALAQVLGWDGGATQPAATAPTERSASSPEPESPSALPPQLPPAGGSEAPTGSAGAAHPELTDEGPWNGDLDALASADEGDEWKRGGRDEDPEAERP